MTAELDRQLEKLESLIKQSVEEQLIWANFNATLMLSLRALLDCRATPTWLKDEKGSILYMNPAFCRAYQLDSKNYLGKTPDDIWTSEGRMLSDWRKNDIKVLEKIQEQTFLEDAPDGSTMLVRKWPVLLHGVTVGIAAEILDGPHSTE